MPKKTEFEKRTASITVTLPIVLMSEVDQEATNYGRNFSEMVAVLVRTGLDFRKAKRAGVTPDQVVVQ